MAMPGATQTATNKQLTTNKYKFGIGNMFMWVGWNVCVRLDWTVKTQSDTLLRSVDS